MKRIVMMAIALSGSGFAVHAQTSAKADSLKVVNLQEVQVVSTRATAKTPVAFTNVRKEQISKQNFGQDIPFLLSTTPSVLTTSDAGAGVGYTTIRVRGTDATRINVTANGIPMNDAESHAIFWVNTPRLRLFSGRYADSTRRRHIDQRFGSIRRQYQYAYAKHFIPTIRRSFRLLRFIQHAQRNGQSRNRAD